MVAGIVFEVNPKGAMLVMMGYMLGGPKAMSEMWCVLRIGAKRI